MTSSLCEPAADFVGDTDDAFRSTSSFDASFVNLTFREEFFCSALPDLPDAALKRTQNIKFIFLGFDTYYDIELKFIAGIHEILVHNNCI